MAITLMAVAAIASRMMNLEKECWLLNAMRRAIKLGRFNLKILTLKSKLPTVVRKVFSGIELSLHMQVYMKYLLIIVIVWIGADLEAQTPDSIYTPNIYGARLFLNGNQLAYPVL